MNGALAKVLTRSTPALEGAAVLVLRLSVGGILFAVGCGKLFGWFGGMGLEATIASFTQQSGIPAWLAYLSTFTEAVGGLLLVLGLLTRPIAVAVAVNMAVAGVMTLPMGFLAVAAYPSSLGAGALAILLAGPGRYALDAALFAPKHDAS